MQSKYSTIDEYISTFPQNVQKLLEQVRKAIKDAAPDAVETFGYGVPAFKLNGKYLVYFAAFKNHIGFYPAPDGIEAFKEELKIYQTSKGAIQFQYDQPLPLDLVTKITKYRAKVILQG